MKENTKEYVFVMLDGRKHICRRMRTRCKTVSETEPDTDPSSHDAVQVAHNVLEVFNKNFPGFTQMTGMFPGLGGDETLTESIELMVVDEIKKQS